jgi:hypothetical protein
MINPEREGDMRSGRRSGTRRIAGLLSTMICFGGGLAQAGIVAVDATDPGAWTTFGSPQAIVQVKAAEYGERPVLHLHYDLKAPNQFVTAGLDTRLPLPDHIEFRFLLKGTGQRNHFEFKVSDSEGNTFLKVWRNYRAPEGWQEIVVPRRDVRYAWGPNPKAQLQTATRIEFAVVSGRGGEGDLYIGPVTLHETDPLDDPPLPEARASSTADAVNHGAVRAVDGSYSTWWSSRPFDPQWIEVDYGTPREIAGLRLYWGGNYGDYDVFLSPDGQAWEKVYSRIRADGGLDEIHFTPVTARALRIVTTKQARRDGYNLIEIETMTTDETPLAEASSSRTDGSAAHVLDGKMNTTWQSEANGKQWLQLDLRGQKAWGGLVIHWSDDRPKSYSIEASRNGLNWWSVYTASDEPGARHDLFLEESESRFLRVACSPETDTGKYAIRQIELKQPEEAMTETAFYRLAAEKNQGCYPRWLSNEQAYWTITGTPEDILEVALCEDGTLEPLKRGFTIMPLMRVGGDMVTRENAAPTQSLLDENLPIPSVHWTWRDLKLDITAIAHGGGMSCAYTRYTLTNSGRATQTGSLFLVIHPMQVYPPWQEGHDGFARIKSIAASDAQRVVTINDERKVFFLTHPDRFAAKGGTYQVGKPVEGDIADDVVRGILPDQITAKDPMGFASGAAAYNFSLAPGESRNIYIAVPLHFTQPYLNPEMHADAIEEGFNHMLEENARYWSEAVNRIVFDVPDRDLANTLKANVAYNLITKDGPGFQPGSRSYDKAWMRDGSDAAIALLKTGFTNEIREFVEWFAAYQFDTGEVPPIIDNKHDDPLWEEKQGLQEFDSQGQFVNLVYEYYCYTGDETFLRKMYPHVRAALEFLQALRERRDTPEYRNDPEKQVFHNILPESRSHEGYWLAHSYWDNFWALRGWKDGVELAGFMDKEDDADWMSREYDTLRRGVYDTIARVMKKYNIDYIPGCAELGDFDATSTAAAIVFCDELPNMPQPQTSNTFERYYKELAERLEENAQFVFTPYEARNILALLFMGQKQRALDLVHFLIRCRRPTNWQHLAEVVHSGYRFPCYIGDMPHTWVGACFINAIRGLFIYEEGHGLVLGAGIDSAWIEEGKRINIQNAPTRFGLLNFTVERSGGSVNVDLSGAASPSGGFVLKSPLDRAIGKASLNGTPVSVEPDNSIRITSLPAKVVLEYR